MQFHPVLNSPDKVMFNIKDNWDIGINPILNLSADNEGEQGNNKTGGEYFTVYSSYIIMIIVNSNYLKNNLHFLKMNC